MAKVIRGIYNKLIKVSCSLESGYELFPPEAGKLISDFRFLVSDF